MVQVDYKKLIFFQKGHEFTKEIYKITKDFPKEETYGLTSQIKRASVSIGSNIAEGSAKSNLDYKRFLGISLGSAKECEYQLLLAKDLEYITPRTYDRLMELLDAIIGTLTNYIRKIES
ncbi:MAG: four helix bundle protein [Nanoarchaeota archaeon]|nr:four helix bundle protein [Nanoarchaeota archaeon]